jgi:hypothetical protein
VHSQEIPLQGFPMNFNGSLSLAMVLLFERCVLE